MHLGLKPSEFWQMRFVDYLRYCIFKAREKASEWEHTRLLYSIIHNVNVKQGSQIKPTVAFPLWTDNLNKRTITKERAEQILESIKRTNENGRGLNSSVIG